MGNFHCGFTNPVRFGASLVMHSGRQWPFMYYERLLEACSWEQYGMNARVHLGLLLGAI